MSFYAKQDDNICSSWISLVLRGLTWVIYWQELNFIISNNTEIECWRNRCSLIYLFIIILSSIYLSVTQSIICLPACLPVCLCDCSSVCISIYCHQFLIYLFTYLPIIYLSHIYAWYMLHFILPSFYTTITFN